MDLNTDNTLFFLNTNLTNNTNILLHTDLTLPMLRMAYGLKNIR